MKLVENLLCDPQAILGKRVATLMDLSSAKDMNIFLLDLLFQREYGSPTVSSLFRVFQN